MNAQGLYIWVLFGLVGHGLAVLETELQYKSLARGCTYQGRHIQLYSEFVPVYNPNDKFGCVRVLCKDHSPSQYQVAVHSCNPEYVNGARAELWPGKMYPDCCKKLRY